MMTGYDGSSEGYHDTQGRLPVNMAPRPKPVEAYTGQIIVRLAADIEAPEQQTLAGVCREYGLEGLIRVLEEFALDVTERAVAGVAYDTIIRLEQAATDSEFAPLRSLTAYWQIDARAQMERAAEILQALRALPEVETAYLARRAVEPGLFVTPDDEDFSDRQGYLDPAPVGIDARYTWTVADGQGAGVSFYDMEGAWMARFEDLRDPLIPDPIFGLNDTSQWSSSHGTASVCIVAARDNGKGVLGVAPAVSKVRLVSHIGIDQQAHPADAFVAAINDASPGDVLLLEIQLLPEGMAVEVEDLYFDAIRLAVAQGLIVIEPAGNGGVNLDDYLDEIGNRVFAVAFAPGLDGLPDFGSRRIFRDSGAIMVGAAHSELPHDRLLLDSGVASSYGARVDCYAWGENVMTCGYGPLGDNCTPPSGEDPPEGGNGGGGNGGRTPAGVVGGQGGAGGTGAAQGCYTNDFGGTSAASAIIAGVAVAVQGKYQAMTSSRLSPGQMRQILSDPSSGTPQGPNTPGNIGVMPDLRTIFQEKLCLVPDVYVRDFPGDTGRVPSRGNVTGLCPDIIVSPNRVVNPSETYGEGSDTEIPYEHTRAEAGSRRFIYVRMRNRGGADADGVRASVYLAPFWTYAPPTEWLFLGTMDPVDVPKGDTFVVAGPLTWSVPSNYTGGALVAVLDHADDPAPPFPSDTLSNWDDALIWSNNNVAWTGFIVVEPPDSIVDNSVATMEFMITTPPDRERAYGFEVAQRLPNGARARLEAPTELISALADDTGLARNLLTDFNRSELALPSLPCVPLRVARLAPGARYSARLVIDVDKGTTLQGHSISIRQLFAGGEIGRLHWQFSSRGTEPTYGDREALRGKQI